MNSLAVRMSSVCMNDRRFDIAWFQSFSVFDRLEACQGKPPRCQAVAFRIGVILYWRGALESGLHGLGRDLPAPLVHREHPALGPA